MFISCREAARLSSESLDRELSLGEKLALRLHLAMCSACRRFHEQLEFVREAAAAYTGAGYDDLLPSQICLSDEAKARIVRALAAN